MSANYPGKVKILGRPTHYLGWKVKFMTNGGIHISQPQYVKKALSMVRMETCNARRSPHVDGSQYHGHNDLDKRIPARKRKFQEELGELRYLADCTHPDIAFHVNRLSSAAQDPTQRHWNLMKNLLKYLKGTVDFGILYKAANFDGTQQRNKPNSASSQLLSTYADADFAVGQKDRKSVSGAIHLYNQAPVAWSSIKQTMQALCTCGAEYVSATHAVQSTQWMRRILKFLELLPVSPTTVYMDNLAAI